MFYKDYSDSEKQFSVLKPLVVKTFEHYDKRNYSNINCLNTDKFKHNFDRSKIYLKVQKLSFTIHNF